MKSFALLRTNVGLTTNIKIIVDSNYNLSLDSIESTEELSNSKFKNVSFIKNNYYDELIPYFYNGLPSDTAFYIKYDNDSDTMSDDYSYQYDEIYEYGARNIINNKNYKEEFEYFAPLYLSKNNLPQNFIIFRVDNPGIEMIDRSNIRSKIFKNFKTVKIFDLTKKTSFGEWLNINFNDNEFFPLTPFEMSFDNLEFSKWNGVDYENGCYISKSSFLESIYEDEKEIFEFEKFVFDGYKNNKVVFPNILNISFLFDDNPANSDKFRKWTINRYYGFYIDEMIKVKTISPYITPFLHSDAIILNDNILYSSFGDPFINGFHENKTYIEYYGEYYKVIKYTENSEVSLNNIRNGNIITQEYTTNVITKYKIISDIDLTGKQSFINKNTGYIGDDKTYPNKLFNYDNTNFIIDEWDTADIWLIEIDGLFHNLIKENESEFINGININNDRILINSDYSFSFSENEYTYWIANKDDSNYTKRISFVVDENNAPISFNIYKLNFSNIKDFDNRIVDTEYSKYEYEKKYDLTYTDETKMYMPNLYSNSDPKDYDDFIYNNEVVNIPVSSEYTANYETFKINNNELSEIWRKNSVYCRWGFQNSNSSNDYPYLLNNSLIFEDYNRTSNPFNPIPNRIERNLDYFYTINSSTSSYIHHTLNIENNKSGYIDTTFRFELDKYLNIGWYNYDYFSYFFDRNTTFDNGFIKKNVRKYSLFNSGDKSIPNITLFKGIKFIIYEVENIKKDEFEKINNLNLKTSNMFDDYKFSILLSENEFNVINLPESKSATMSSSSNLMNWTIIDNWKMDKQYHKNDIVIMDDILYVATSDVITTNPENIYLKYSKSAPYNQTEWQYYTYSTIFWNPTITYDQNSIVYNNDDYYYYLGGTDDFWNPIKSNTTGYSYGDIILFKGEYYMSMTNSNNHRPDFSLYDGLWSMTQSNSAKWSLVPLWNPSYNYPNQTNVVHNDVIYNCTSAETGDEPGVSSKWNRLYSIKPDTTIKYNQFLNKIIEMNNSYYMINSNISESTLENGINIYINKRWKNILINITISDNTVPNISECDRDLLYNELNEKLTAYNLIRCVNDLSNTYGYTDYLNYIIIDEENNITKYNYSNIDNLPYYIICEYPDEISIKHNSLKYIPISLPNDIKLTKKLTVIDKSLSNINDFNDIPISCNIIKNYELIDTSINYHGGNIISNDLIYRFSGFYMPIFYDIELFNKDYYTSSVGNYKFDTDLYDFAIMKERKIRKINHNGSVLKLNNIKHQKSLYPMIDEFGYTTIDYFIFKSSWDYEYYYMTSLKSDTPVDQSSPISYVNNIGIQSKQKNINL